MDTNKRILTIALVNVWKIKNNTPHFGLTSLAAYIRQILPNTNIKIIEGFNPIKKIMSTKADLIGFTSDTLTFNKTKSIALKIKAKLNTPIILGGVHITAIPNSFSFPFDIGVIGEGEITFLELINLYIKHKTFPINQLKKTHGLIFRNHQKNIKTPSRKLIENIDMLPFPARDLTPMAKYLKDQFNLFNVKRLATIMTTRGCPYHCVFCGSPVQWGRARFHSPEYIIKEIKYLLNTYQIDGIMFWDDLFIAPTKRLEELKNLILKEKLDQKITFFGYARANLITPKVCRILSQMNTKRLIFGLESGSPKILNYLKQNSVTVKDNKRAVLLCRKYNLTSSSGYIVGTPGEKIQDLKKTYNFMKKYPLDNTQIYILTPYPGTKIWQEAVNNNLVSSHMDFNKLFVQLPALSFLDFFHNYKNLITDRIFLNTNLQNNKNYLKMIFKIQRLAYIQNFLFYLKIIPQNLDLIKRILYLKIKNGFKHLN